MNLSPSDFGSFFHAIHGYDPFPWQQRLVTELAEGSPPDTWPDVLDLPTGSGKTAALDAAVFHLALRADEPGRAALRIALVVDRRLVVDDAFGRARKIEKALRDSLNKEVEGWAIVTEVAHRLKELAGQGGPPLVAQRLRGGAPLERDWARTPTQPTILCSTVDQVGSRLLFRGYGVSDRMKPVHAGLLGVNSLILLDEAHLSEPFRQTLDGVCNTGLGKLKVALLSATPGQNAECPFTLSYEDQDNPVLSKRLKASKVATLVDTLKPKLDKAKAATIFAHEARVLAKQLQEEGVSSAAVGIVVNRVALARDIFTKLIGGGKDAVLMIGRSRSVARDEIVSEKLAPFRTGNQESRSKAKPLLVVATQCLEVGVDLDLDGLVTQAASLDALRQRFGRLNRAGRPVTAKGVILPLAEDIANKPDDPVYGDRIRLTWEALKKVEDQVDSVDFGVEALPEQLKRAGIEFDALAAERPDAPVLMPAYLDLWSQTWPRPTADPEVSLFLHGSERTTAGVSIVWRGDISEEDLKDDRKDDLRKIIGLVPPRAAEAVEVPLWVAREWLKQPADARTNVADVSDAPEREVGNHDTANRQKTLKAFRWAGADDSRTGIVSVNDLRTGDLVVVPAEYGGCDKFGWAPDSKDPVLDVADQAAKPYWVRRCAVRITRDAVRTDEQWKRIASVLEEAEGVGGSDLVEALLTELPSEGADDDASGNPVLRDMREPLNALLRAKGKIDKEFPYGNDLKKGAILVAERGVIGADDSGGSIPSTEDDCASIKSTKPVYLNCHGCKVARFAKDFTQTLCLQDVADDLELAAYLHDAGKADPRFQVMLAGGDPWNRPDGPPLAKSGRSWSPPQAWERAGLPKGWRHEALSVRMARLHPELAKAHDPALVLWLIGTHHGYGRPFFNFLDDDPSPEKPLPCLEMREWPLAPDEAGPQSLAFDFDGRDWPSLFGHLKRRYGIWGLAHLEAILRLADHRASEEERK
ncbi:MAG: type I-U CRISPR-associated helicase/endonuclease Cas3 [Cyanobacteria bacterium MAG CAR4_bin_6]|nr:type I-U CRISPR-associated helicase/endonuclease Cas3 [Cyanobacteria bacterium MAG CAR4_bin_6]